MTNVVGEPPGRPRRRRNTVATKHRIRLVSRNLGRDEDEVNK